MILRLWKIQLNERWFFAFLDYRVSDLCYKTPDNLPEEPSTKKIVQIDTFLGKNSTVNFAKTNDVGQKDRIHKHFSTTLDDQVSNASNKTKNMII